MKPVFNQRIADAIEKRKQAGLERRLQPMAGANKPQFSVGDKGFINFSSNDYLGLAASKELADAWIKGIELYGSGAAASPMVTGFSPAHQQLEDDLCSWLGYERAVLFGSGFSANQAVLFTLLEKQDLLLQDKLNHASLMEAGMLSPAKMKRFRHNDTEHLKSLLTESPALVVTEGAFSMDGDQAPVAEISRLCRNSGSWMMLDDAHGIGVLGQRGEGSICLTPHKPELLIVTFGKAFGLSGAAVLCDQNTGDFLTQFARHHVYSTAIPPAQAHALSKATTMLQTQQWRRDRLAELQDIYHNALADCEGYVNTDTPIKPFICGTVEKTMGLAEQLKGLGVWVKPIRPPTVPAASCRIRITLTSNHTPQQVTELAESIIRFQDK